MERMGKQEDSYKFLFRHPKETECERDLRKRFNIIHIPWITDNIFHTTPRKFNYKRQIFKL